MTISSKTLDWRRESVPSKECDRRVGGGEQSQRKRFERGFQDRETLARAGSVSSKKFTVIKFCSDMGRAKIDTWLSAFQRTDPMAG